METQSGKHQVTVKSENDDDTRTGVLLRALGNGSELQKELGDHTVLNAYRVESFADMKREIQEYLGMKEWLTRGAAAVCSIAGKGKQKATSNVN